MLLRTQLAPEVLAVILTEVQEKYAGTTVLVTYIDIFRRERTEFYALWDLGSFRHKVCDDYLSVGNNQDIWEWLKVRQSSPVRIVYFNTMDIQELLHGR